MPLIRVSEKTLHLAKKIKKQEQLQTLDATIRVILERRKV